MSHLQVNKLLLLNTLKVLITSKILNPKVKHTVFIIRNALNYIIAAYNSTVLLIRVRGSPICMDSVFNF